jgi:SAM-dependent methyltransferase
MTITNTKTVSDQDKAYIAAIRSNVSSFLGESGAAWGNKPGLLLDVAPQDHEGARPYFAETVTVETLDINPAAGATYCADLCRTNENIPSNRFDVVVCTEVLEHVLNPFAAAAEIHRVLKPGGVLLASSPFNFRIHGPLPDCWRFTEHGWRALLSGFENVKISALEDKDRFLMPIHHTVSASKLAQS